MVDVFNASRTDNGLAIDWLLQSEDNITGFKSRQFERTFTLPLTAITKELKFVAKLDKNFGHSTCSSEIYIEGVTDQIVTGYNFTLLLAVNFREMIRMQLVKRGDKIGVFDNVAFGEKFDVHIRFIMERRQ